MADNKIEYRQPCQYCGTRYRHSETCTSPYMQRVRERRAIRANGFEQIDETTHPKTELFKCLYGCGTLVWDMRAHRENVCRGPIVG